MSENRVGGEQWAYIGSFTEQGGHGITTAALDPGTGALTPVHHTGPALPNPSCLARAAHAALLYAVSELPEGGVRAFSLADPAHPVALGPVVPVDGSAPTHLTLAGGRLWTANYGSGSVSSLALAAGGEPLTPAVTHQHHGTGPDPARQTGPHAHAVVPDPSGRWLLATDLGTDEILVYGLDGDRPPRAVPARPGTGPRHLAFHPDGTRLLLVSELEPTVTTWRWDAADGGLRALGECRTLPEDTPAEGNHPSGLVISPDGRFAWVANRGHDSVAVLALDGGPDGTARLVTTVPCGGHWPRSLTGHPTGRLLYCANERSGDVTWFVVDPADGVPRRAGSVPAPAASWVALG
ncbi:lactonase family protein [Streptomyces sp. AJS327]|uniref:lactonase family protein n=1 Tax=Streptomyces sp. AJS327 TaxID=2545265 RepID=UPI0015DE1FD6|nr:lactonase family protein [Streptomyces sp. AJS327]MBA0052529.1 lactonase family protein [Streptomyces sp. AJS327]